MKGQVPTEPIFLDATFGQSKALNGHARRSEAGIRAFPDSPVKPGNDDL